MFKFKTISYHKEYHLASKVCKKVYYRHFDKIYAKNLIVTTYATNEIIFEQQDYTFFPKY